MSRAVPAATLALLLWSSAGQGIAEMVEPEPTAEGSYALPAPAVVVEVAVRVTEAPPKQLWVELDGNLRLPLAFDEQGHARQRVPRLTVSRLRLLPADPPDWNGAPNAVEVRTLGAPPEVAPQREVRLAPLEPPDPPEPQPKPLCSSYMCSYFEKGLTDGITVPETRAELIGLLRDNHVAALRYPGGSFAYTYPPDSEAGITALKDQGLAEISYNAWWPEKYGWVSEREYFRFCKEAGLVAWYEVNPGYWYEAATNTFHQIRDFDPRGVVSKRADRDRLPEAAQAAAERARWCAENGIGVVWEIGNEDYVYYSPTSYAEIAAAFIKAIRAVVPDARFAVCIDGYDWGDWSWREAMLPALRAQGVARFDYGSTHCYLHGAGVFHEDGTWSPLDRSSPEALARSIPQAWGILQNLFTARHHDVLAANGFGDTKIAMTEFNQGIGDPSEREHSLGRAVGEAIIYPQMVRGLDAIFFHDLVRSGPESGNWFQRFDYYPELPAGSRYHLQVDGAVMRLMARHAGRRLRRVETVEGLHVAQSVAADGTYTTLVNASAEAVTVRLPAAGPVNVERVWGSSPEAYEYDFRQDEARIAPEDGAILAVAPAWGLVALTQGGG